MLKVHIGDALGAHWGCFRCTLAMLSDALEMLWGFIGDASFGYFDTFTLNSVSKLLKISFKNFVPEFL